MEQQNQFLLQRLSQMESENNRLNRQVAQLSAEIRGSRGTTPKSVVSDLESPTLTPTLFKQERDELAMDKIPFPTPSLTDYSPSLKPTDLAEASDLTQHPAAVLCDLQCQSKTSKDQSSFNHQAWNQLQLQMTLQLLCLTMTSAAYSTVILPLLQILSSMKAGSPLTFSTEETCRHLPLIHWLISTPSLSTSTRRSSVFRKRVLSRLLACSPALARPLRDATGKALQLAVSGASLRQTGTDGVVGGPRWESLMTMAWAIDAASTKKRSRTKRNSMRSYRRWDGDLSCILSGKRDCKLMDKS
jgi:transcriptional activator HAC1